MSDWDELVSLTLRRGDAAAVVQSLGFANNIPVETERGRQAIQAVLLGPVLHARSNFEVREWLREREAHERRNAPEERNTPASGMTMGALETLDRLKAWLDGDDEA